jgi:hypothetical protein
MSDVRVSTNFKRKTKQKIISFSFLLILLDILIIMLLIGEYVTDTKLRFGSR